MLTLVIVSAAALGVDYGWQPTSDRRGVEYIIQIEPELLGALRDGLEITSDVPPEAEPVHRFRIRVGTAELPRQSVTRVAPQPAFEEQGFLDPPADGPLLSTPETDEPDESVVDDRALADRPPAWDPGPRPFEPPEESRLLDPSRDAPELDHRSERLQVVQAADAQLSASTAVTEESDEGNSNPAEGVDAPGASERPWWVWTATLLGLFASLGGNAFLGWVNWDQRSRYRELAARLRSQRASRPADDA